MHSHKRYLRSNQAFESGTVTLIQLVKQRVYDFPL
jgi:hypothetical protein